MCLIEEFRLLHELFIRFFQDKRQRKISKAEKQRRYRLKLNADPERRRRYVDKKRETYKQDVASGKRKLIGDLSTRDQRKKMKDWKIHQQTTRSKRDGDLMTPPESPENLPDAEMNRSRYLLSVYQATCHIFRHEYRYHILQWRTSIHYDRIIR